MTHEQWIKETTAAIWAIFEKGSIFHSKVEETVRSALRSALEVREEEIRRIREETWRDAVDATICATDGVVDTKRIREDKENYLKQFELSENKKI